MDHDDLEAIRRLKYRYFRTLDLKRWDEFTTTLSVDAVARYGTRVYGDPVALDGRNAIMAFMREQLSGDIVTVHVAHHPEIDTDGDVAEGSWCFEDTVIVPEQRVLIQGAGYYRDTYVRGPGANWEIASTEYERIYESMQSIDDTPSFRLLANRWDADGSAQQSRES